jgi:MFS family permease
LGRPPASGLNASDQSLSAARTTPSRTPDSVATYSDRERWPGSRYSVRASTPASVSFASRRAFRAGAGSLAASWSVAGLFLSLMPSVLVEVFRVADHLAAGALIATLTGAGGAAVLALQHVNARRALVVGATALVLGSTVTVSATLLHVLPGVVVGALVAGVGFGAGFQAPVRLVLATAPPTGRASLISAVYVVSYVSYGLPALVAGILVPSLGLTTVVALYGGFVVLAAVAALVQRTDPGPPEPARYDGAVASVR